MVLLQGTCAVSLRSDTAAANREEQDLITPTEERIRVSHAQREELDTIAHQDCAEARGAEATRTRNTRVAQGAPVIRQHPAAQPHVAAMTSSTVNGRTAGSRMRRRSVVR